jgi:hypothetical protein
MDALMDNLQRTAARSLVRYAAGRHINCPDCGNVLDAGSTVVASDGDRCTLVLCASCWGKPAMHVKAGSVEVLDGRLLFKPRRVTRQWSLR